MLIIVIFNGSISSKVKNDPIEKDKYCQLKQTMRLKPDLIFNKHIREGKRIHSLRKRKGESFNAFICHAVSGVFIF